MMNNSKDKKCCDCGKEITFQEFCRDNPWLQRREAYELWENPHIATYCLNCFFNRPEKPFRVKKRVKNYYSL
ncbi:MAG: hypothetical protein EU532_01685 [Promethearchaeota archaeon]|nr:MAG: hypothetical protein EU532_01685 [Candidatus Lokiarchaeota archaeon]